MGREIVSRRADRRRECVCVSFPPGYDEEFDLLPPLDCRSLRFSLTDSAEDYYIIPRSLSVTGP